MIKNISRITIQMINIHFRRILIFLIENAVYLLIIIREIKIEVCE